MAGKFRATETDDLKSFFMTEYELLDQYVGDQLFSVGGGTVGQLGDNTAVTKSSPVQIISGGTTWSQISCGYQTTSAIKTDGTLWSWGDSGNGSGQLGDNTTTTRSSPVQTVSAGTTWKQISCGKTHSAAIKTDGTLWTWGDNFNGGLGDNSSTYRSSPVQTVSTGTNWKQVVAGLRTTAAIKTDGTLWTWGDNSSGQLGDNTVTIRSSPVQIGIETTWKSVAFKDSHIAAIKTDGTLWAWGLNTSGQLGDNTNVTKSSPVQVTGNATTWELVSCGGAHTGAIKTDGTLWMWGAGTNGRLGDNTAVTKSSPVQTVSAGSNWKYVACGISHTAAIKTDSTLWTWGLNTSGQLGDYTAVTKSSPIQMTANINWKQVSAGNNYTSAVTYGGI